MFMKKILQPEKVNFGDLWIYIVRKLDPDSTTEILKYKRKTRDKVNAFKPRIRICKMRVKTQVLG